MPRKINPIQTKEKILTVSAEYFVKKGYENTNMQEIVQASGVSKGAIFHHFNTKEEILDTLIDVQYETNKSILNKVLRDIEHLKLNGKEKMTYLLLRDLEISEDANVIRALSKSPSIILKIMQLRVNRNAYFFAPLLQEGIEDGSITCQSPVECSQVFSLLYNDWCNPSTFECDLATVYNRLCFLQNAMKSLGADVITDELITANMKWIERYFLPKDSS